MLSQTTLVLECTNCQSILWSWLVPDTTHTQATYIECLSHRLFSFRAEGFETVFVVRGDWYWSLVAGSASKVLHHRILMLSCRPRKVMGSSVAVFSNAFKAQGVGKFAAVWLRVLSPSLEMLRSILSISNWCCAFRWVRPWGMGQVYTGSCPTSERYKST